MSDTTEKALLESIPDGLFIGGEWRPARGGEHCNVSRRAPITPPRTVTTTGSDADRYWED